MDLWSYVKAVRRWWWLALGIPAFAFIAAFLLVPAPWQTEFRAMVVFPGHPDYSGSQGRVEAIILDDVAVLLGSGAFIRDVHATLPQEMRPSLTSSDISGMLSATRYSRAVTVTISGSSPEEIEAVAQGVESVLPGAINAYLVPPETDPATVEIIDRVHEPEQQTTQRVLIIGIVTVVAGMVALCLIALIESLRLSYRAKYG
jgi:capsular polysaccharide biosynthesis protein